MRDRSEISAITGIPESEILNVYAYGSEVYGTSSANSDEDYIIVRDGEYETSDVREGEIDVTIYDRQHFQEKLDAHYIANLECLWLPERLRLEKCVFHFDLTLSKLRASISESCNISYVKCKKRLDPENYYYDPYSAKKSLWHALRMAAFGIQIAHFGKITDYSAVNKVRNDILSLPDDWKYIKKEWQPTFNHFMTEFRKVAPKE